MLMGAKPSTAPRPDRARGTGRSGPRAERLEVEVALDAAQDVVADHAVVAQPDDRLALGDRGPRCRISPVLEQLLLGSSRRLRRRSGRGSPRARTSPASCSMSSRWSGYSAAELLEPAAARPRRRPAGRAPPRPSGAGPRDDAEAADEPRQRQALADERRQDHAERQEAGSGRAPGTSVSGRASAAASETTPRMPAHETTKTASAARVGSRARMLALSQRGR